ncbi:MAG: hypothetical protein AB1941_28330 [Gemmatimonadota bacterium]
MTAPATGQPTVRRASVEVLRIFDAAYGIDLAGVERILQGRAPVARIRLQRVEPKAIAFDDPPVVTDLVAPALEVGGRRVATRASARIYSFGVVSLSLEVTLPAPLPWGEFETFAREAEREAAAHPFWRSALDSLLDALGSALDGPTRRRMEEDYTAVTVRELDPPLPAAELLRAVDLVPLLTHETRPLAEAARRDVLRHAHSYYLDDLVVLTWDRAFILEPWEDDDVADVLEVANAQLLELRYYDALLDEELPRMYALAAAVRGRPALTHRRYARAASEMRALVAEITLISEKVDNALKVTEDVYLARVYASALDLFRFRFWTASIDRKLSLIRDTYTALYDEAVATRAELLEVAIVVLILFEIVWALLGG